MKSIQPTWPKNWLSIMAGVLCMALAACGGGAAEPAGPTATPLVVPTMPSAQFAAPTTMIGTGEEITTEAEAEAATPEPDGPNLAQGERIYANQECAACHGGAGEGVADEGGAIAATSLTEQEFEDLMRTGGDIGPDHLYGPSAISPGGLTALHAWIQSLPPTE